MIDNNPFVSADIFDGKKQIECCLEWLLFISELNIFKAVNFNPIGRRKKTNLVVYDTDRHARVYSSILRKTFGLEKIAIASSNSTSFFSISSFDRRILTESFRTGKWANFLSNIVRSKHQTWKQNQLSNRFTRLKLY